jgi:hypothetical protein
MDGKGINRGLAPIIPCSQYNPQVAVSLKLAFAATSVQVRSQDFLD